MSAPQHIGVGAPTGRLASVGEQTCRLPSKLSLVSRRVGCLAFGSRPVGSPANCRWGADRSVPQNIAVGGPTCRLPRHCHEWLTFPIHSSPTVPVMSFGGFPLHVQNGGHETGANTIIFMGFWDCTFGDDVVHMSSVSLEFKCSHFDTCM